MNKTIRKVKLTLCRIFGHSFDITDLFMAEVKACAENKDELTHTLVCKRCGKDVLQKVLQDKEEI